MAESNRRGGDAADDRLDDEVMDDSAAEEPISRGGTATRSRKRAESADSQPKAKKETGQVGIFGRLGRFIREVVAELRKVIWPTRKELLTYTAVVVVFVTVITSIVVGLDLLMAKGALWLFGSSS